MMCSVSKIWSDFSAMEESVTSRIIRSYQIFILTFILFSPQWLAGQTVNGDGIYGHTGIVTTPVAYLQADRKITFGWQVIPADQAHLEYSQKNGVGEQVYFARIGFLPWVEASIRLVHPNDARSGSYGIGDRSIFLKFRILNERMYWPALAIGVYDPIGTKLLPASYVVASKSFPISGRWLVNATSGYGFELFDDVEYLVSGFWAGCQILPAGPSTSLWPQWTAGVETHMNRVNLQAGIIAFSIIQFNAYLLDLRDISFGVSASLGL